MKVVVLKTGRYDPTLGGSVSKYVGYIVSTRQVCDLPLIDGACKEISSSVKDYGSFKILGHSTLLRAVQTSECIVADTRIPCNVLNEVKFDLSQLVTEEEFVRRGSSLVRQRFIEAFLDDSLLETRLQLLQRIDGIYEFLTKQEVRNVCLISHSFVMKLLEATTQGVDLRKFPERLSDFIKPEIRTYDFGKGFSFNFSK